MFQTFHQSSSPDQAPPRVAALRAEMSRRDLDGFIVPHADEYQNEYLPDYAERLSWLTGFTGSAGTAIVMADHAIILTDGRYTIQVDEETDGHLFQICNSMETPPSAWIEKSLQAGTMLGYDPKLHTADAVKRLKAACEKVQAHLIPCDPNPLDVVWDDQPPPPQGKARVHPLGYAGQESAGKCAALANELGAKKVDAAVITDPTSVAWLLNIRGSDVHHTPLVLARVILHRTGKVDLFIDPAKIDTDVDAHLGADVFVHAPEALEAALKALGAQDACVLVDPMSASSWFFDVLENAGAKIKRSDDPCVLPKAIKNNVEIAGTRAAHERDGAALTTFLAWLAREAPSGKVDEIEAVTKLEDCRAASGKLLDVSFDTISGSGPHGAIVHYRVTEKTNRLLQPGELFLVDSGGQYLDGTTDVTRTMAIGQPSDEMRDRFTRVLKGMIRLSMVRFPHGTTGAAVDILARQALWSAGLDFDHGTGHGVGSYLSVHEGPQGIHRRSTKVELKPGMILSNEPGYYKTDAYGIRIENLIVVTEAQEITGGERPMMGFDTLTLAPIDRALIDVALLAPEDLSWLNAYHVRVRDTLSPRVDADTKCWLEDVTQPL